MGIVEKYMFKYTEKDGTICAADAFCKLFSSFENKLKLTQKKKKFFLLYQDTCTNISNITWFHSLFTIFALLFKLSLSKIDALHVSRQIKKFKINKWK